MTRAAALLLAVAAPAGPLAAQYPPIPALGAAWYPVSYPKLFYASRDGVTFGFYTGQILPLRFDEFYAPPPYRALLGLDADISTRGSKTLRLDARLPMAADGWRFTVSLAGMRRTREPYFGIGSATVYDESLETDAQPHFYRADRTRFFGRGEVQRRIVGPLRALVGLHAERWKVDTLAGPTRLGLDLAAGEDPRIARFTTDVALRFGLVVDTRDDEVAATRGVRVEVLHGIADADVAGDLSYTRTTLSAAGYAPVTDRLTVAGRLVAQLMGGAPPLGSLFLVEASDNPYRGLGGPLSHRGLITNRFLGEDKLIGNVDVRYLVYHTPTLLRVSLVGFLDAGRVFHGAEAFRLTTDDLQVGGGGGLFIHMFRAAVLGTTLGVGPDGATVKFHTEWTY